jgi:SNF2 family DNA or RNA helicase
MEELTEDSPISQQPPSTLIPLRHHQLTLLKRCLTYESEPIKISLDGSSKNTLRTRVGIIGDMAGSGKSFVVLSLVCHGRAHNDNDMPHIQTFGMNNIHICIASTTRTLRTNLLVIPHNLTSQWEKYIVDFCPSLKYVFIKTNQSLKLLDTIIMDDYDLLIVTSTHYNKVLSHHILSTFKFTRAFFDEVDNMSIPNITKPNACFTWFITASYNNLLHPRGSSKWNVQLKKDIWNVTGIRSMGFVKSLFQDMSNSMSSSIFKLLVVKNEDVFVVRSMTLLPIIHNIVKCQTPNTINLLNGLVDKTIISHLNAGDVTSALQFINSRNKDSEENIIIVLIAKYIRMLKVLDARHIYLSSIGITPTSEEQDSIFDKQRDTQRRIDSIRERITSTNTCCICYESIMNKSIVPCCSNSYCLKCISTWLSQKKECPMCKTSVSIGDLLIVNEKDASISTNEFDVVSEQNSKSQNLEIMIKKMSQGHKTLIFSSYDKALSNVGEILKKNGIKFSHLKGNIGVINNTLRLYKEGDVDFLLINPKYYGCGINMENTTDIIMLHKFDSEIERQVIGRAQRHGRTQSLKVWYLLYENECLISY